MLADIAGYLQIEPWPPEPGLLFWAALTLVAGGLIGETVFRRLALPRIVGYSAVGMVIALTGSGLSAGRMGGGTRLIVDLALALLLFELGSRVNARWLRRNPALLWTSAVESLLSFVAMFLALRWLGLDINVALTCATFGIATSAAVIGRVSTELKTAGQVTERMIVLTALNTLYAVLAHRLVLGWLHLDEAGNWVQGVVQPFYTFGGSVLLAIALARLVAWVARRMELRDENSVLLLLGLIVLALTTAQLLNLSTLLVPLIAGALLRNTTERPWVWPRHFGTAGGVMVLMLFVIVGASWSLEAVALGGVAAIVLLLARGLAKALAVVGMARWSGIRLRQGGALALALTPISGTALVLYAELYVTHPEFSMRVAPIILSAIAIMALLGPIAVQGALRLAGEYVPRQPVPAPASVPAPAAAAAPVSAPVPLPAPPTAAAVQEGQRP